MDVMWFRISRNHSDPGEALGHVESGRMLVMLNRNDYGNARSQTDRDGSVTAA
jgi:hypothetical protein